jgi:very-short-patch-repair endonuclease
LQFEAGCGDVRHCGVGASVKIKHRIRNRSREMRTTMTDAEAILWSRLQRKRLHGYRFQRQLPIGEYFADFACREARLVIELDGATHSTAEEREYDARRTRFIEAQGWGVVRFWNAEVYENLNGVLESILLRLPPPSR